MVEIQCPHCEKDIELEDGLSGMFDCPYCNNEFVWEDNENGEQTDWLIQAFSVGQILLLNVCKGGHGRQEGVSVTLIDGYLRYIHRVSR
jgi:predicted RNA-binding Zn-ribbon protein involved in translation (DUF1610 family)